MTKKVVRLSPTEWTIWNAAWRVGPLATLGDIMEELREADVRSESTIQTLLQRIVDKGYLEAELSRGRLRYTPTISWRSGVKERAEAFFDLVGKDGEEALLVVREALEKRLKRAGR